MPSRRPLPASFYRRDTEVVARDLLGCRLTRLLPDGSTRSVILVETEAYLGVNDRAAHTWNGRRTARVEPMWGEGGHAYVYFVYGMHFCMNVVTQKVGTPEAVLLRAGVPEDSSDERDRRGRFSDMRRLLVQPPMEEKSAARTSGVKGALRAPRSGLRPLTPDVRGIRSFSRRPLRGRRIAESSSLFLASGPAKLCSYLGVTTALSGASLSGPELILSRGLRTRFDVLVGPRVGVDYAGEAAAWPLRFAIAGCPAITRPKGLRPFSVTS
ncbi:MAG: DNA-3-methyladenine glycosylase [Thermoanaerobaculia bacterium]|nr:DNA-3-methyladenine glycosylase [Thermoanaerobaculia bacterium]